MLVGIFSLPAIAQQGGNHSPEEKATMMTNKMAENLDLTGEQKEAVYAANLEMAQKMESTRLEAYKENQAKLKEILTEDQYKKMQETRSQRHKEMKHHKNRKMNEEQKTRMKENPEVD